MVGKITIIVCLILPVLWCEGQTIKLFGIVKNEHNVPIPFASIVTESLKDSSIIDFSSSDKDGEYSIEIAHAHAGESYVVYARMLGYRQGVFRLPSYKNGNIEHNFILEPNTVTFNEVIIKGRRPIQQKSDTTIFDVKTFVDGTEKTVEDLLKKIPGINVNSEGKITVKGRPIDKVLIEGEDFFSKNYRLVTRNLAVEALDKIEAIDNYSENPLLKSVEQSGKVVLNLKVKEEAKLKAFGNIGVGGGIKNRYWFNSAIFSLVGKVKFGSVTNLNNIGYDPILNSDNQLSAEEETIRGVSNLNPQNTRMMYHQIASAQDMEPRRFIFNDAKLTGLNANWSINERLKIKAFGYFYHDNLSIKKTYSQRYFTEIDTIKIYDSTSVYKVPRLLTGQFRVDYLVNDKNYFRWITDVKEIKNNDKTHTYSENVLLSEQAHFKTNGLTIVKQHRLNFVHKIKEKQVFQIDLQGFINKNPQLIDATSKRYKDFFGKNFVSYELQQNVYNFLKDIKGAIQWKYSPKYINISVSTGFFLIEEALKSDLLLIDSLEKKENLKDSSFYNNLNFTKKGAFVEGFTQAEFRKFKIISSLSLQRLFVKILDQNIYEKYGEDRYLINGSLGIGYEGDLGRLFSFFNHTLKPSQISDVYNGYLIQDYRTFRNNQTKINFVETNAFGISYVKLDLVKYYSISGNASFTNTRSSNTNTYRLTNTISLITNQPIASPINHWLVNGQFDKLITDWFVKFRVEGTFSRANVLNKVNTSDLSRSVFQTVSAKINLISAFKGAFNTSINTTFNKTAIYLGDEKKEFSSTNVFQTNIMVMLRPKKELFFNFIVEQMRWQQSDSQSQLYLIDAEFRYMPLQSKWSFEVAGRNLLNQNHLVYSHLSNYLVQQDRHTLQSRFVMLSLMRLF